MRQPGGQNQSLWDSENGTVRTQAAKYEFKLNNRKRRRGPISSEQSQPLNNTPLQAKGNTNPGNHNSEYNTRDYIKDILKGELMGKYAVARDLESFLGCVIPEAALPESLDKIMDYITAGPDADSTSGNADTRLKAKNPQLSEGPNSRWLHFPELRSDKTHSSDEVFQNSSNEEEICTFAQGICDSANGLFKDWPIKRFWTSAFADKSMKTNNINAIRKPDFVLVNEGDDVDAEDFGFRNIFVVGEHKEEGDKIIDDAFLKSVLEQVNDYAYCTFEAQDSRRFLMAIIWIGSYIQLVYYDRGAVLLSPLFNIHENPRAFLHIIIGLAFMADELMGFDPTVIKYKGGRYILFKGERYRIKAILYRSLMVTGRATTVYYVTKDGVDYVLKDYWALLSRGSTEVDFLLIAKSSGVKGIPDMVGYEDVEIGGRLDSCDHNRGTYENNVNRFHRRILFKGRAAPITTFRSKKELLRAILDIIECHRQLYEDGSILHKDISLYNLMFATCGGSEIFRKGLLIDYDYSGDLDDERRERTKRLALNKLAARLLTEPPRVFPVPSVNAKREGGKSKGKAKAKAKQQTVAEKHRESFLLVDSELMQDNVIRYERMLERRGQRTGTHPFIAAALLLDKDLPHCAKFDLESIYYVLIYMATRYVGPARVQKKGAIPYFIYQWTHPEKFGDDICAHVKRSHKTETDTQYTKDVLSHLTPYMADLAPMFLDLKNALGEDTDASVSHANFSRIIKKMEESLPDRDKKIPRKKIMPRDPQLLKNTQISLEETVRAGRHHKMLISADPAYTLTKVRASGEREELDRMAAKEAMKEEADGETPSDYEEIADEYEILWEDADDFEDFSEFEYEESESDAEEDGEGEDGGGKDGGGEGGGGEGLDEDDYLDRHSVSSADTLVDPMKQSLEDSRLGSRIASLTLEDRSDGASFSSWDNVVTLGHPSPSLLSRTLTASEDWGFNSISTSASSGSSKLASVGSKFSKLGSIDSDSETELITVDDPTSAITPSPTNNKNLSEDSSEVQTPNILADAPTTPAAKPKQFKMTRAKAKQLAINSAPEIVAVDDPTSTTPTTNMDLGEDGTEVQTPNLAADAATTPTDEPKPFKMTRGNAKRLGVIVPNPFKPPTD